MSSDVVYLGVLHTEHWRVGLLFLQAGKNVLCEKPFAMNSRQVKSLVAAAKKNNVFLMEVRSTPCNVTLFKITWLHLSPI